MKPKIHAYGRNNHGYTNNAHVSLLSPLSLSLYDSQSAARRSLRSDGGAIGFRASATARAVALPTAVLANASWRAWAAAAARARASATSACSFTVSGRLRRLMKKMDENGEKVEKEARARGTERTVSLFSLSSRLTLAGPGRGAGS